MIAEFVEAAAQRFSRMRQQQQPFPAREFRAACGGLCVGAVGGFGVGVGVGVIGGGVDGVVGCVDVGAALIGCGDLIGAAGAVGIAIVSIWAVDGVVGGDAVAAAGDAAAFGPRPVFVAIGVVVA